MFDEKAIKKWKNKYHDLSDLDAVMLEWSAQCEEYQNFEANAAHNDVNAALLMETLSSNGVTTVEGRRQAASPGNIVGDFDRVHLLCPTVGIVFDMETGWDILHSNFALTLHSAGQSWNLGTTTYVQASWRKKSSQAECS